MFAGMALLKPVRIATAVVRKAAPATPAVTPKLANSQVGPFVTTRMRNAALVANSAVQIPFVVNRMVLVIRRKGALAIRECALKTRWKRTVRTAATVYIVRLVNVPVEICNARL